MTPPQKPERQEIRLTAAEHRFLRAFVRRQALPLLGGALAVAFAVTIAVLGTQHIVFQAQPEAVAPDVTGALEAFAGFETEVRAHLEHEATERERLGAGLEEARVEIARLEQRLSRASQQLAEMAERLRSATPPAAPAPGLAGATLSPDDAASLQGRVFNVEKRQDREEALRQGFEHSVLERLEQSESQRVERSHQSVETEKSVLNRLFNAEARIQALEAGR